MRYTLKNEQDYIQNLTASGITQTTGEPTLNTWSYHENTLKINNSSTGRLAINIPIANLNIGDKIKISADIKILGGVYTPQVVTSIVDGLDWSGTTEGLSRTLTLPDISLKDYQTVTHTAVFEGYEVGSATVPNVNNKGAWFARLFIAQGGACYCYVKNLTVEIEHNISGLHPSSKLYYGVIAYNATTKTISIDNDSSKNLGQIAISKSGDGTVIYLDYAPSFNVKPTCIISTTTQVNGNNNLYEVSENTSTTSRLTLSIYNKDTSTRASLNDITVNLYISFLIIGA